MNLLHAPFRLSSANAGVKRKSASPITFFWALRTIYIDSAKRIFRVAAIGREQSFPLSPSKALDVKSKAVLYGTEHRGGLPEGRPPNAAPAVVEEGHCHVSVLESESSCSVLCKVHGEWMVRTIAKNRKMALKAAQKACELLRDLVDEQGD